MNGADSVDRARQCPLCGSLLKQDPSRDLDNGVYWIDCDVCKEYGIAEEMLRFNPPPVDAKRVLSAIVRRRFDFAGQREVITPENYRELVSQAPDSHDVPSKVRYLLGYIAHKSSFPGDKVILTSLTDYPICFAANKDEFEFYVRYAIDAGFVEKHDLGMRTQCEYCLTSKGWEETRRVPTLASPYAFVAMSFSSEDDNRAALLTQAFDEAIKPAIEDDAGYLKAIRVDREEFLGDIVDEIIARIKECRFVVADATEHRNGVYFEAGYAMGMGLPVIWTCHKDDMPKAPCVLFALHCGEG
ncbi:MAG: hypothetical protein NTW96_27375 [Planctomycetia bacterium]|nr:hypothetical protein [Planctomycetia bacterium]